MRKALAAILIGATLTLCAATPPKPKAPVPTVESVKALSAVDLLSGITDNEELMLDNAHGNVTDTLRVVTRINAKRLEKATYNLNYFTKMDFPDDIAIWSAKVQILTKAVADLMRLDGAMTPPPKKKI